jgi:5-methylcytosine-specific restriction endonuclease McrA
MDYSKRFKCPDCAMRFKTTRGRDVHQAKAKHRILKSRSKRKSLKSQTVKVSVVQADFNKLIRLRDGKCMYCGTTENLQCSHVKSVGAYPHLRLDDMNAITLCMKHHLYWWHKEPTEAGKWFENTFPDQALYLEEAVKNKVKVDRQERYNTIKELLKRYDSL